MHERRWNPGFRKQEIEKRNMRRGEGRKADNEEEMRRYWILRILSETTSNGKNNSVLLRRPSFEEKK